MFFIAAKPQPSLLVSSIHDSTPCDSPWILAASSFAFPKMLPGLALLWLLLDESGKEQKRLFPLECEGAGGRWKVGVGKQQSPGPLEAKSLGSWGCPRRWGEQTAVLCGMAPGGVRAWDGSSVKPSAPASLALFHG